MSRSRIREIALLSLLVAAPASSQPTQMTIQVWSFGFAPHPIHLAAGRPVTLTFVNLSDSSHDFSAPDFFEHASLSSGVAPRGEIDLKPRETRAVTLVPNAGRYQAHCSHFMHKQMGMEDVIVVD